MMNLKFKQRILAGIVRHSHARFTRRFELCLRADFFYFLCCTFPRATKEMGDFCTQANLSSVEGRKTDQILFICTCSGGS